MTLPSLLEKFLNAKSARSSLAGPCHNHPQQLLQLHTAEARARSEKTPELSAELKPRVRSVGTTRWHRRPDCRRAAATGERGAGSGAGRGTGEAPPQPLLTRPGPAPAHKACPSRPGPTRTFQPAELLLSPLSLK